MKKSALHKRHIVTLGVLSAVIGVFALLPSNDTRSTQSKLTASTLRIDPRVELASCTPDDDRYFALFFRDPNIPFEDWPGVYHQKVNDIVELYLEPVKKEDIQCDEIDLLPVTPDNALFEMASKLAPWNSVEELQNLQRNDVGFVLLEFLRVYECALLERRQFLRLHITDELAEDVVAGNRPESDLHNFTYGKEQVEVDAQMRAIQKEMATARPALERAMQVIAGASRLVPLDAELQCLQRISLDLRNALSLAADTSSCLPRIWDTRDVLRDQ